MISKINERKFFEYTDAEKIKINENEFFIQISPEINSKSDLLNNLAKSGNFPEYFGKNWDALEDSLRDLSWIEERGVVIYHFDLPLKNFPEECRVYLEILQNILEDWSVKPDSVESSTDCMYVDHEIRVVFPSWTAEAIANLLDGRSQFRT